MTGQRGSPGSAADSRVVVITGAGGGIGSALADAFADCSLVLLGRDGARLAAVGARHPQARLVIADLLLPDSVVEAVNGALAPDEHVDAVIHNAGLAPFGPVAGADVATWTETFAVNATAPAVLTAALLPGLRRARGHVVFIGSGQSLSASPGFSAYAASKFALRALADALRSEEREAGVRVSSIYPGQTATAMQARLQEHYGTAYEPSLYIDPATLAATVRFVVDSPRDADLSDVTVRPGVR